MYACYNYREIFPSVAHILVKKLYNKS